MAYTINNTSGTVLATVADGTIDTTTDLTLVGKNYAGYGEFLNENYIKLLENFANTSAPGGIQVTVYLKFIQVLHLKQYQVLHQVLVHRQVV
jgi:hypothetical protein